MTGSGRTVQGRIARVGLGAAGATAVVALVAGCSSSSNNSVKSSSSGPSTAPQGQPAGSASAGSLQSKSTSIGTVLVDSSGRTVYELVGDSASNPNCTGSCLAIWPEVKVNGTQVVVNGHPAFTFAGDTAAGQTKGQNLKDQWGVWLALDPKGNPITPAASATTTAPNSGGAAF